VESAAPASLALGKQITGIALLLVLHYVDNLAVLAVLVRDHRILGKLVLIGGYRADAARVLVKALARRAGGVETRGDALQEAAGVGRARAHEGPTLAVDPVPTAVRVLQRHAFAYGRYGDGQEKCLLSLPASSLRS
jgi:hypothetical protein